MTEQAALLPAAARQQQWRPPTQISNKTNPSHELIGHRMTNNIADFFLSVRSSFILPSSSYIFTVYHCNRLYALVQ